MSCWSYWSLFYEALLGIRANETRAKRGEVNTRKETSSQPQENPPRPLWTGGGAGVGTLLAGATSNHDADSLPPASPPRSRTGRRRSQEQTGGQNLLAGVPGWICMVWFTPTMLFLVGATDRHALLAGGWASLYQTALQNGPGASSTVFWQDLTRRGWLNGVACLDVQRSGSFGA